MNGDATRVSRAGTTAPRPVERDSDQEQAAKPGHLAGRTVTRDHEAKTRALRGAPGQTSTAGNTRPKPLGGRNVRPSSAGAGPVAKSNTQLKVRVSQTAVDASSVEDASQVAERKTVGRNRYDGLCAKHPALAGLVERAKEAGVPILTGTKGTDIFLKVGPMQYRIGASEDIDDVVGTKPWQSTEDQIHSLGKLMTPNPRQHVILGWCVGNRLQSIPGRLAAALDAHTSAMAAASGSQAGRLSAHTAAHQARWNPNIIERHFDGFRLPGQEAEVVTTAALHDEAEKRAGDAMLYRQECGATVQFDALVHDMGGAIEEATGSTPKELHIKSAARQISGLVESLRSSPEPHCVEFRTLLSERQGLLQNLVRAKVTNRGAQKARNALRENEDRMIATASKAFEADGPTAQRRAQLALHSMDVLEQTAIGALNPKLFPKGGGANKHTREASLQALFPSHPRDSAPTVSEFQGRILSSISDPRSTTYMASQEFEFTEAAKHGEVLYVYPSDPGPFITAEARPRIFPLIGEASDPDGIPFSID